MDTIGRLLNTPSSNAGTVRAELWADALIRVLSCWIPLALASVVVGGNLIGPSLECFPLHLASVVAANADNVNGSSAEAGFRDPGLYSSQLDEFVNAECGKQTSFDYRVFTLMLVAQSVVMFAPQLLWHITRGRRVICNLNFIKQYLQVLYKTHGPEAEKPGLSGEKEFVTFVKKLITKKTIYHRYLVKQVFAAILAIAFIVLFCVVQAAFVRSVQDNFKCTVNQELTVNCSVTSASLYRITWSINICLLVSTGLTFFVDMFNLHCRLEDKPFSDVGISITGTNDDSDDGSGPQEDHAWTDRFLPKIKKVTDCHLMYTFLKANIDVIEKYNYMAILHETLEEEANSEESQGSFATGIGEFPVQELCHGGGEIPAYGNPST